MRIEVDTIDRYGRVVGKIFLNDLNINKEMVKAGHAWVYVQYAKDKTLFALEKEAKNNQTVIISEINTKTVEVFRKSIPSINLENFL